MARRRARRPGAISELPPLRILTQLALLQALYYAVALVLTVFSSLVAGQPWKPALVFGWADVRGDVTTGWLLALLMVLDGGVVVGSAIVVLVGRSKLVPDFAISTQAIHLLVVYLFNGMPRNNMWWMAAGCSAAVASFLGIIGSRSRELQPISFGGRSRNGNGAPPADEEAGEAGLPRLPARDGAGDYEMVAMTQR